MYIYTSIKSDWKVCSRVLNKIFHLYTLQQIKKHIYNLLFMNEKRHEFKVKIIIAGKLWAEIFITYFPMEYPDCLLDAWY